MRTFNFALILITGIVCIVTYRVAEEARVARASLIIAERQIAHERQTLTVLGAEWASLTRPQRIHALAARHLDLADVPAVELASFAQLPHRGAAPLTEEPLRNARVILPAPEQPELSVGMTRASYRTGT